MRILSSKYQEGYIKYFWMCHDFRTSDEYARFHGRGRSRVQDRVHGEGDTPKERVLGSDYAREERTSGYPVPSNYPESTLEILGPDTGQKDYPYCFPSGTLWHKKKYGYTWEERHLQFPKVDYYSHRVLGPLQILGVSHIRQRKKGNGRGGVRSKKGVCDITRDRPRGRKLMERT